MAPSSSAATPSAAAASFGSGLAARSASARSLAPDEILQAVVVADSFNRRFRPLTLDTPRCLLPLVNIPLIEYTLEILAVSGVQEIFVVCCCHADQIKDYIRKSRWSRSVSPTVTTIVSQELRSMGDVLRDLDTKQILQSDFVLVSGDVISNVNLQAAIGVHKQRRVLDKNAIMTMLMRQASPNHPTRAHGEEKLFVLDAKTHECVHYESSVRYPIKRKIKLDSEIFKTHSELLVRNDLIDCQIDICSIEVPALFTENFDYQDIRRDFLRGILESDLLGKTIFCHVLEDGYAARVSTQQMYHSVSKDIMARWTYPLVPDNSLYEQQTYTHSRPYIYKEKGVQLARSAEIKEQVTIGRDTRVGDKSVIKCAVIGRNCRIGENVRIQEAYLMQDVTIGNNCTITQSMLGAGVTIKDNVVMGHGCVIGPGVVIGPNVVLPSRCRVSLERVCGDVASGSDDGSHAASGADSLSGRDGFDTDDSDVDHDAVTGLSLDDDDGDDTGDGTDHGVFLGSEARGYIFVDHDEDDDDEDTDPRNIAAGCLGYEDVQETEPESNGDTDGETSHSGSGGIGIGVSNSTLNTISASSHGTTNTTNKRLGNTTEDTWQSEVNQTLERAFTDNHTVDIAALELNTLKMAMNTSFDDLRRVVIPAILSRIDTSVSSTGTVSSISTTVRNVIMQWGPLITKFTHCVDDQTRVLDTVAVYACTHSPGFDRCVVYVFRFLYDVDVVDEDVLVAWYRRLPGHGDDGNSLLTVVDVDGLNRVRELAAPLIKWLQEAEEDDDDDEEDEEDDEDDEEEDDDEDE